MCAGLLRCTSMASQRRSIRTSSRVTRRTPPKLLCRNRGFRSGICANSGPVRLLYLRTICSLMCPVQRRIVKAMIRSTIWNSGSD